MSLCRNQDESLTMLGRVGRLIGLGRRLATHPRMAAKYAAWLGAKLTGRECIAGLPGGGTVGGFHRFTDYWSLNVPSAAEFKLIRRFVRPGAVVADIGANLGTFAVTMSRLSQSARVLAFEPSPATVQALRANVERNRLGNVEVFQVAVSDQPGRVQLTDDPTCSARNHLVADQATAARAVWVDAVTLDQFCAERAISHLAFVKSDTEGAEARVIRGAAGLLRDRRIDALLIEMCAPHLAEMGSSVAEFVDAVERYEYAVHRLAPDGTAGSRLTAADLDRVPFENVLVQPQ